MCNSFRHGPVNRSVICYDPAEGECLMATQKSIFKSEEGIVNNDAHRCRTKLDSWTKTDRAPWHQGRIHRARTRKRSLSIVPIGSSYILRGANVVEFWTSLGDEGENACTSQRGNRNISAVADRQHLPIGVRWIKGLVFLEVKPWVAF